MGVGVRRTEDGRRPVTPALSRDPRGGPPAEVVVLLRHPGKLRETAPVNLILLTETDRVEGVRFRVEGTRAAHVAEVLCAEPGRALRVGLLDGPRGVATVVRASPEAAEFDCTFDVAPPPRPRTDLVLAIPRA